MEKQIIPLDEPYLGREEAFNLYEAIQTGWISALGPFVGKLEEKFAEYHGVKFAKTCMNGTVALTLMLQTLKIGPGDEVIIPTLTFSADAFTLSQVGAKPVFVDCAPGTFTMDPEDVRKKITPRTKAITPTHLYGRPANMDELRKICDQYNLYLVEDCSQAQGAEYKGKKVGSIGDFSTHSFHNKLVATGEGGMIMTNNEKWMNYAKSLMDPAPMNVTDFAEIAVNQRMSNLQAAVGLAQFERLEETVAKKLKMAAIYDEEFKDSPGIIVMPADPDTRTVYWRYTLMLDENIDREEVERLSKEAGFVTRGAYKPLHLHPYYREYNHLKFPVAENIGKYALDIPSSVKLTEDQILWIAKKLKEIIASLIKKK